MQLNFLIENEYSTFLMDRVIKKYLNHKFSSNQNQLKNTSDVYYFKLSYIGNLSQYIEKKVCKELYK